MKKAWLSRDLISGRYNIHTHKSKPVPSRGGTYIQYIVSSYSDDFHELYKIRLRKGQCKEIKSINIVLK